MIFDVYKVGRLSPIRVTAENERDALRQVDDARYAIQVYEYEPPRVPRFSVVKPQQRWEHRRKIMYTKARKRLGPPLGAATAGTAVAALLLGLSVAVLLVGATAGLYGYVQVVRARNRLRKRVKKWWGR